MVDQFCYDESDVPLSTFNTIPEGAVMCVAQSQASASGFIYSRSVFNAKGQLVQQYRDTGWNTPPTAPTLFEYDAFGNVVRQTLALAESPTPQNSPTTEFTYGPECTEDGIFTTNVTRSYTASGGIIVQIGGYEYSGEDAFEFVVCFSFL
ncbi:MAG: hypothetical protein IKK45_02615 [Akkermansia sp.]|nr:hypothetical protein [Akkermansia sp.]